MKTILRYFILLVTVIMPLTSYAQTPAIKIGKPQINDVGMNKLLYRWGEDSYFSVDDSGFCFEMSLPYNAKNLSGERIFCYVFACDEEGQYYNDRVGRCGSITAHYVKSNDSNGTFHFVMPQGWIVNSDTKESGRVYLMAQVFTMGDKKTSATEPFVLSGDDLKIDNKNVQGKLMSDIFSGSGADLVDDFIGAIFGGSSASSTQPCPSCDGTRLCQSCDGDGFFFPEDCRKCSTMPGVCRRCKGTGEVTIKVDYNDSWF